MGGRRPEGWEEGQGQSRRRREPLFWEKEIKHLLQQVLGTPLGAPSSQPSGSRPELVLALGGGGLVCWGAPWGWSRASRAR